jgi:hypothetical protein
MTNTPVLSTNESEKEGLRCCVCIEDINTDLAYISCTLCNDGKVCSNCSVSMLENGLLVNCPLCRQENWYKASLVVVVDDNDKSNYVKEYSCLNKLYEIVNRIIKISILLGITWQLGAFIIAITHRHYFDNIDVAKAIFIFIPGAFGMCFMCSCYGCCYKHFEFTRRY